MCGLPQDQADLDLDLDLESEPEPGNGRGGDQSRKPVATDQYVPVII